MKRLKNKVFWLLFGLLSLFLIGVLILFNYQNYKNEKNQVMDALNRVRMPFNDKKMDDKGLGEIDNREDFESKDREELSKNIFLNLDVYTVLIEDDNLEVINHTGNNDNDKIILNYAKKVTKRLEKGTYIGNLYFEKYCYSYSDKSMIIVDNYQIHQRLYDSLKNSIILFCFIEIFISILATLLTRWITKPVIASFNKQKQFIADASHELKTPLAVIMANADALENDMSEKKWLNNITEEANRMNHLITNLLDLARLEEQKKQNNSEINLSKELEKSILTFESLAFEKKLKLNYEIDENIFLIGNIEDLKQLFAILMDNAIEHSNKNGIINVTLKRRKKDIFLEFKNSGEGIPKGQEEKIFERFYRVDESRNRDSNHYGLGLAIAKEIVERYQGTITASSHNGYTTFLIQWKYIK